MSLLNILKIVDDEELVEQMTNEMKEKKRSQTWENRITTNYKNFKTGKKFNQGKFECYTSYKCLEKVLKDQRSVQEIQGYYEKYKNINDFNDFATKEIYFRVRKLIVIFFPNVTDNEGRVSFNQSLPMKLSDMKKYVFEAAVFVDPKGKALPWKNDFDKIREALSKAFKMTVLEKNQSIKKSSKRNAKLALANLEFDYEEQRLVALDMYKEFYKGKNDPKYQKPKKTLLYGTLCIQLTSTSRLTEPVRSVYNNVPLENNDILGDLEENGTFAELTPDDVYENHKEHSEILQSLKTQLIWQQGLLKKQSKNEELVIDRGVIKIVNFISVHKFLQLVRDVQEMFKAKFNRDNKNGRQISNMMSDPKYRDQILNRYYKGTFEFFQKEIGTQTKTHFLRALGASISYYTISKNSKVFFNNKLLGRNTVGAMILGHSVLGSAFNSYDYITITGRTVQETAEIFQVTDENLVVTLSNRILQLEKAFTEQTKQIQLLQESLPKPDESEEKKQPFKPENFGEWPVKDEDKEAFYKRIAELLVNNNQKVNWPSVRDLDVGVTKREYEQYSKQYNSRKRLRQDDTPAGNFKKSKIDLNKQ